LRVVKYAPNTNCQQLVGLIREEGSIDSAENGIAHLFSGDVDRFVHNNPRDCFMTTRSSHRPVVRHVVVGGRH